jgi:hypothetical protein
VGAFIGAIKGLPILGEAAAGAIEAYRRAKEQEGENEFQPSAEAVIVWLTRLSPEEFRHIIESALSTSRNVSALERQTVEKLATEGQAGLHSALGFLEDREAEERELSRRLAVLVARLSAKPVLDWTRDEEMSVLHFLVKLRNWQGILNSMPRLYQKFPDDPDVTKADRIATSHTQWMDASLQVLVMFFVFAPPILVAATIALLSVIGVYISPYFVLLGIIVGIALAFSYLSFGQRLLSRTTFPVRRSLLRACYVAVAIVAVPVIVGAVFSK